MLFQLYIGPPPCDCGKRACPRHRDSHLLEFKTEKDCLVHAICQVIADVELDGIEVFHHAPFPSSIWQHLEDGLNILKIERILMDSSRSQLRIMWKALRYMPCAMHVHVSTMQHQAKTHGPPGGL